MKHTAIKSLMAAGALFAAISATATAQYPEILRSDKVYYAGTAECPDAVVASNGDIIVAFSNHGDVLPGNDALFVRSTDGGKTWSEPYLVMHPSDRVEHGTMVGGLVTLDGGDILGFRIDVITPGGKLGPVRRGTIEVVRSKDGGNTFDVVTQLKSPAGHLAAGYGPMTKLADGTLLLSGYIEGTGNGYWESKDGGATWSDYKPVWKDPPPDVKERLWFNETAYEVLEDGTIYSIGRNDVNDIMYSIVSKDNGKTWSEPKPTNIIGGSPALHRLKSGALLLAHRDGGRPGVSISMSVDGGENWRYLYALPVPEGVPALPAPRWERPKVDQAWQPGEGHGGYPAIVELQDGNVYIIWHHHDKNVPAAEPGRSNTALCANLLSNPDKLPETLGEQVFPVGYIGAMQRAQEINGKGALSDLIQPSAGMNMQVTPLRIENSRARDAKADAEADQVYYVLEGEASVFVGANADSRNPADFTEYKVAKGDLVVIPRGIPWRVSNPDKYIEVLSFRRLGE